MKIHAGCTPLLAALLSQLLAVGCGGDKADTAPADADDDGFLSDQDCDDDDASVYPAADELCDGVDNDCDGEADEYAVDQLDWYLDADGDSYGEPTFTVRSCGQPEGYAAAGWDCDDADDAVFPGAAEVCDGLDNDCDGLTDSADASLSLGTATTWYRDADQDGYGDDADAGTVACEDPSTAFTDYVDVNGDCDDASAAVAPDQEEICGDGQDNDCDGRARACEREGDSTLEDADATVFGSATESGLGQQAAGAGDVDGDGQDDLWVSTRPLADLRVVSLLRGPLRGSVSLSVASATLSSEGDGGYGAALGSADADTDGWPDLLVGDRQATDAADALTGAVYVYSGPLIGDFSADIADARLSGPQDGGAGAALALVEGGGEEGETLLWVGAPTAGEDPLATGAVALISGPFAGEITLEDGALWLWGDGEGAGAGEALASGDLDGDGVSDLMIGASSAEGGAGRCWIWLGTPSEDASLADAALRWTGAASGDGLGRALAFAGDTDEDGYGDALVGAPGVDLTEAEEAGTVWLIAGGTTLAAAPDDARATLSGAAGDGAGTSLSGALDLSADDVPDLLIGAPGREDVSGAVFAYYGPVEGALAPEDADWTITGSASSATGFQLVTPGDLSGDGLADLAVGAPLDDRAGEAAGALAIFATPGW